MVESLLTPISKDAKEIKTKARLSALLGALEKIAIVSATDIGGNITYVNEKFIDISKYSREELIGKNHRILKSGYHDEAFFKNLWETISTGEIWRGEIKNKAKDGSFYWVDSSISPTFDDSGKIMGYVAARFPITELKQEQEALNESEKKFRALIENSKDLISILSFDGTIKYESPSIKEMLGYSQDELVGENAFNFIHPDDLAAVKEKFAEVIKNPGKVQKVDFRFLHKSGTWLVLESIGNYDTKDAVPEVVVNSRDITARKEAENNLEKMNQFMIDRELKMIELKQKIAELEGKPKEEK